MIDIHTHILPGIDDGAKTSDESIKLLETLGEQGVKKVVFTPHYYGRNRSVSRFLKLRDEAFEKIKDYHGGISVLKGCECNLATCANTDFAELKSLAIEGTRYILTELSFENKWDNRLFSKLNGLLDTGLIPVVAHAELYPAVQHKPELVHQLISTGCLIQVNCDSFADKRIFPLVKALINHAQVHCLGSDTHNLHTRFPKYGAAAEKIIQEFGQATMDSLQDAMDKILADRQVEIKPSTPVKRSLLGKYA